jgi:hypothetical protein
MQFWAFLKVNIKKGKPSMPLELFHLFLRGRYCKEMAKNLLCLDDYFFNGSPQKGHIFIFTVWPLHLHTKNALILLLFDRFQQMRCHFTRTNQSNQKKFHLAYLIICPICAIILIRNEVFCHIYRNDFAYAWDTFGTVTGVTYPYKCIAIEFLERLTGVTITGHKHWPGVWISLCMA